MFFGTQTPKLDEKGRFFLPAKYRAELGDSMIITKGQERCLVIYPMATFVQIAQQAMSAPTTVRRVRDYQRMLAASAADVAPDRQGRVIIPQQLRDYAELGSEIVVNGAFDRVEIWNLQAWEVYRTEQEETFADLDDEVFWADE